jgi:hypothetical protein
MADEPLKFEYRISPGTAFLLAGGSLLAAGELFFGRFQENSRAEPCAFLSRMNQK